MSSEDDFERQVRFLERELAAARETLRDRFAMAALPALIVGSGNSCFDSRHLTRACYVLANNMLEARKS